MPEAVEFLLAALLIGAGATLVMDAWTVVRKRMLGVPALDYALVGRWLGWLVRGRLRHHPIAASAPVRGEQLFGWVAHYLTGIAFAAILLACWGMEWARLPTLGPALVVGIGSVAAPFLLMQQRWVPALLRAVRRGRMWHGCIAWLPMRCSGWDFMWQAGL